MSRVFRGSVGSQRMGVANQAEWRSLNSSIFSAAFSLAFCTDWLILFRLSCALAVAAFLCDCRTSLAASLALPQVSFAAP